MTETASTIEGIPEQLKEPLGDFGRMVDEGIPHSRRVALFLDSVGIDFEEATDRQVASAEDIVPLPEQLRRGPLRHADAVAEQLLGGYLKMGRLDIARDIRDRLDSDALRFNQAYVAGRIFEQTGQPEDLQAWSEAIGYMSEEVPFWTKKLLSSTLKDHRKGLRITARHVETVRPLIEGLDDNLAAADYWLQLGRLQSVNERWEADLGRASEALDEHRRIAEA